MKFNHRKFKILAQYCSGIHRKNFRNDVLPLGAGISDEISKPHRFHVRPTPIRIRTPDLRYFGMRPENHMILYENQTQDQKSNMCLPPIAIHKDNQKSFIYIRQLEMEIELEKYVIEHGRLPKTKDRKNIKLKNWFYNMKVLFSQGLSLDVYDRIKQFHPCIEENIEKYLRTKI